MAKSDLERTFEHYARIAKLPAWECEYRFHLTRKWRMDTAWPEQLVCVELEGAVHSGGRHVRGVGFEKDCEKYNMASSMGWVVLRYTDGMLKKDPMGCMEQINELLKRRGQPGFAVLNSHGKG